jgi:hypothetical protein
MAPSVRIVGLVVTSVLAFACKSTEREAAALPALCASVALDTTGLRPEVLVVMDGVFMSVDSARHEIAKRTVTSREVNRDAQTHYGDLLSIILLRTRERTRRDPPPC